MSPLFFYFFERVKILVFKLYLCMSIFLFAINNNTFSNFIFNSTSYNSNSTPDHIYVYFIFNFLP